MCCIYGEYFEVGNLFFEQSCPWSLLGGQFYVSDANLKPLSYQTAHFFQHPQNILFIPKAHIHFLIKSWQLHCHLWKQSMVLCETVSGHIKTIWSSAFVLYLWVLLFFFVFVFVFLFVCLFILKQFNQVCLESIIKDKW